MFTNTFNSFGNTLDLSKNALCPEGECPDEVAPLMNDITDTYTNVKTGVSTGNNGIS